MGKTISCLGIDFPHEIDHLERGTPSILSADCTSVSYKGSQATATVLIYGDIPDSETKDGGYSAVAEEFVSNFEELPQLLAGLGWSGLELRGQHDCFVEGTAVRYRWLDCLGVHLGRQERTCLFLTSFGAHFVKLRYSTPKVDSTEDDAYAFASVIARLLGAAFPTRPVPTVEFMARCEVLEAGIRGAFNLAELRMVQPWLGSGDQVLMRIYAQLDHGEITLEEGLKPVPALLTDYYRREMASS